MLHATADAQSSVRGTRRVTAAPAGQMVMQTAGRGHMEAHPPGHVDGTRFEGRFVIFGMIDGRGQVFGNNASLFDENCVRSYGRGPQCAHFVAVRSGYILQGFESGDSTFTGNTVGRTATSSRVRVYYDAHPNGTRSYENRASFLKGKLIGVYTGDETFSIDPRGGVFDTRVDMRLLSSRWFTYKGHRVNLRQIATHMTELDHGHNPEPDPNPEAIPYKERWFSNRGPGTFVNRFPVGGAIIAVR
jgi:hypothetical protein